ncbi:MAG: pilus assembly protein PilM [Planctomycetes bacterium]|nr:pilus assembly protein PilM [Planctomycetota bacterium]
MGSLFDALKSLAPRRKLGRYCALDFDGRHLRVVQADSTGGQTRILKLVTIDMPAGLDLSDAAALGAFVGRALDTLRLKGAAVLMNVPRGQAILKPLVLPPVAGPGELARMVQFQAAKEFTFKPDEAVIDFTIESHYGAETGPEDQPEGEHVLVAAVQRPVLEYYQKVAAAAGVRLLRLGLRPYANIRCVEVFGGLQVRGRAAVVHVTSDETEIDVMEGGGLTFSRSAVVAVPVPGGDPAAEAEAVSAVVQEVTRSLQSYMAVERGQRIDAVLLAGGTGIEEAVAAELTQRLHVRCELFRPAPALGLEDGPADASAFIAPLGLAVGQGDAAAPPFDFLNPKRPPVERDVTKIVTVAAVSAVVLVVVSAFAGAAMHLMSANGRVGELTEQLNGLTKGNRKVAALKKRIDAIDGWAGKDRNWLDQWASMSAQFPACTEVYASGLTANPDGSLGIGVRARTNEAIEDLAARLGKAGYEFKPGQVTTGNDRFGYTYTTSVKVIVKPGMKVNVAELAAVPRPADDVSAQRLSAAPAETRTGRTSRTRPGRSEAPAAPVAAAPEAPAAPDGASPVEVWQAKYAALMKERPPADQAEALAAWRERREVLRRERPENGEGRSGETRYPNGRF